MQRLFGLASWFIWSCNLRQWTSEIMRRRKDYLDIHWHPGSRSGPFLSSDGQQEIPITNGTSSSGCRRGANLPLPVSMSLIVHFSLSFCPPLPLLLPQHSKWSGKWISRDWLITALLVALQWTGDKQTSGLNGCPDTQGIWANYYFTT